MVTKRRKAARRLIGKRESKAYLNYGAVNERLAKCENTPEMRQYSINLLRGNGASDIQQEEGSHNGQADYGREVCNFEHEVSENLHLAYMKEVAKIPLLSEEEEKTLARQIQEGQRELVRQLLKLDGKRDELDILAGNKRNLSDEFMVAIMATLGKLEKENRVSQDQMDLLSEMRNLCARLTHLKGEMLKRNLRLVIKIAKGYMYSGINFSDLVQEGNLGLMKAVTKFDYKRGCKFSTYATWWIRQAILRAIAEKERTIRIPVHIIDKRQRLKKTYTILLEKEDHIPSPEEIAEKARIPLRVVHKVLFPLPETISLETPVGEDSSLEYLIEDERGLSPCEEMERREVRQLVERLLSRLLPREAEILRMRFGIGRDEEYTLEEIGRKFGISRERVRQLEKKGINRLRHWKRELSGQGERIRFRGGNQKPSSVLSPPTE